MNTTTDTTAVERVSIRTTCLDRLVDDSHYPPIRIGQVVTADVLRVGDAEPWGQLVVSYVKKERTAPYVTEVSLKPSASNREVPPPRGVHVALSHRWLHRFVRKQERLRAGFIGAPADDSRHGDQKRGRPRTDPAVYFRRATQVLDAVDAAASATDEIVMEGEELDMAVGRPFPVYEQLETVWGDGFGPDGPTKNKIAQRIAALKKAGWLSGDLRRQGKDLEEGPKYLEHQYRNTDTEEDDHGAN